MTPEEENYYIDLYDKLLDIYSLEELMDYSDWSQAELLAILHDLQYLELPNPLPV